mmetsp:Transcript_1592/g.2974  ORF Transcript_1592/g.2974 Transcript_1592/m.2974 type:complete len:230 (+) Transcript_1592:1356-2045(+)
MGFDRADDPAEHFGRNNVHLVHEEESPFPSLDGLHDRRGLITSYSAVGYHCVGGNQDASPRMDLVLFVRGEDSYIFLRDVGPQFELVLPLKDGNGVGAEADDGFFNGLGGCDASESFASATGEDDDARSRASIAKHLTQTPLLIPPNPRMRLQIHGHIGIHLIVPKIILLHQRIIQVDRTTFHHLDVLAFDLKRYRRLGLLFVIVASSACTILVLVVLVGITIHFTQYA